jgi:hypothetical protein
MITWVGVFRNDRRPSFLPAKTRKILGSRGATPCGNARPQWCAARAVDALAWATTRDAELSSATISRRTAQCARLGNPVPRCTLGANRREPVRGTVRLRPVGDQPSELRASNVAARWRDRC